MEVAALGLRVDGSPVDKAAASLDRLTSSAGRAESAAGGLSGQSRRANDSLAQAARSSNQASSSFSQLSTAATLAGAALASLGVANFARQTFEANRSAQQLQASLKTVTGSVEAASAAWDNLLEFAAETPFTLDQSVQGFIRMQSLGLNPTNEALRSFGNTAAAMGRDLMQMVEAVADATTGEFERLKEFGIRASREGDQVSFTFQGVTTTVANSADAISEYLEGIGNLQFAGAMADQMDTLGGKASNLEDSIYQLYLAIGEQGATDVFASALDGAIGVTEALTDNLDNLATAASALAAVAGGRLAGSLGLAAAAKIAATREALRYQAALATMAGISGRAAVAQTALATAARGASTALALVGGPLGLLVGAAGLLYVFREELGLTRRQVGLTEEELASLREEMAEASGEELSRSLQQVDQALVQVGLKAAAAREELARLRSESSGSGVLGFEGGRVGEEVRGMQAVAEFTAQITRLEQERAVIARESGSRSFKPLSEWLFEVDDANQAMASSTTESTTAVREAQREAERFASTLSALQDELFPLEAEQRQYRENQELLNSALEMGEIGLSRYAEAVGRLEESYQNAGDAAEVYGLNVDSAERKASSLNDTARDLGFAFESAFESAIQSGGSLRDVLDGILDDVISIALRAGVTEPLGRAVSGAFQGVDFGSVIGSFFGGGRLNGGPVSPGRVYEVTEDGNPEMLTVGQRNYLLPGSQAGTVTPFSGMPAMGSAPRAASSPVNVYISTPPGTEARTEERQNAQGGRDLHVIIDEITAGNLGNPGSRTGRAMRNVFGAQRNLTGRG